MFDCITIGDIKMDTFVVIPEKCSNCKVKMPEYLLCFDYGEKIPIGDVESQIAGSAPNVAVGLSRLDKKTSILSYTGQDGTLKLALEKLTTEKVDTKLVIPLKGAKSSFAVVLNYKGEKTILANHIAYPYHLPKLPKTKWIYICETGSDYKRLYKDLVPHIKKNKISLGFNPGAIQVNDQHKTMYDLISVCKVLFVNVGEAQKISKVKNTLSIGRLSSELYKMGPEIIVITDGRNGAYMFNGKTLYFTKPFPNERIEATGAGDAFATGFLGALMEKQTTKDALTWGTANSSSVVNYIGPQKGLLNKTNIRKWMRKYPNIRATGL